MEQGPKEEIEDTRDQFMDYIGNALNGLLGVRDNIADGIYLAENEKEKTERALHKFFERIRIFLATDFKSTETINRENIELLLSFEHTAYEDYGEIDKMQQWYCKIVDIPY